MYLIKFMDNLTNKIYQIVSKGKNVLLVGPTDSGKTWYIKNTLIPFLQTKKIKAIYFSDPCVISELNNKTDIFIIDEIETLFDQDFLTGRSIDPEPYYSETYLTKVKLWHDKLKKLTAPSIYILTRNNQEEIDNIANNFKVTDWGAKVKCLIFDRQDQNSKNKLKN